MKLKLLMDRPPSIKVIVTNKPHMSYSNNFPHFPFRGKILSHIVLIDIN